MIREIINFTSNLSESFKMEGVKPKDGLHIMLSIKNEDGMMKLDTENYHYEIYSKKMKEETPFITKCKMLSQNAWCIDTNKCFDLPTKAIHSCSPYMVAFKREHIEGGQKFKLNKSKNKKQITERFKNYFEKANSLFSKEEDRLANQVYQFFFSHKTYLSILNDIIINNEVRSATLMAQIEKEKGKYKDCREKAEKDYLKEKISHLDDKMLTVKNLEDSDYIVFYLDKPIEEYKFLHARYLSEKLFNTDKYNTPPDEQGVIFGTSDFMNTFNSNMPFLSHQTASFDITCRISNKDSKALYDFKNILSRGTLPIPLPIFIYKEELNQQIITLFKESGYKMRFVEMVETLWKSYKDDFKNYYFLYWQNTKDGIVFNDYDFVSQFDYECDAQIENLFEIQEKGGKSYVHYQKISNVFQLERNVFSNLIGVFKKDMGYSYIDYFTPLEGDSLKLIKKQYQGINKFITYSKYRKVAFDYIYKSQRQGIDTRVFSDMVFSHIKDDIKNNNEYSVKEKLNIWFSLYEHFDKHKKNNETMASKLKDYQGFVAKLAVSQADLDNVTDQHFAFAAGQVIEYVIQKSKTESKSYQLLEPYLQQSKCTEFKRALANDIARYKHAINDNETRFKNVCAFVQTYDTERNLKELLPEILAGVFAKNEFFTAQYEKKES